MAVEAVAPWRWDSPDPGTPTRRGVPVGAGARLLGPLPVEDGAAVGPGVTITQAVPLAASRVGPRHRGRPDSGCRPADAPPAAARPVPAWAPGF